MAFKSLTPWRWGGKPDPAQQGESDPFGELQEQMNMLFEDFFGRFNLPAPQTWRGPAPFTPAVDMTEDAQAYYVEVELPGMEEQDLQVTLNDDVLILSGEKKSPQQTQGRQFYRMERCYGAFRRSLPMPSAVVADRVSAQFKNGVLSIVLPKSGAEQESARRIPVQAG